MVRRRWWVIGLWALAFMSSLTLAPRVGSVLKPGFGEVDTESRIGLELMAAKLGIPKSSITLVFSSERLDASDPRYAEAVKRAVAPLESLEVVDRVVTYYNAPDPGMVAPDGRTTYALVRLKTDIDSSVELFPELRRLVASDELDLWITGGIAIFSDLNDASEKDLRRAEVVTLPLVLVALVVVFGGVVAAGLPVAMGVVSIAITLAMVYLLGQHTDLSIFVLNIASFLGLGMAVDYSLLMLSRFREELARHDVAEAVAVTCATAGRAIVFSGATTVVALSGLLFFDFMMLRSLGIGGVAVILTSMLMAMTLVPALLGALGPRVNSLSVVPRRAVEGRFWLNLARWVMRHPIAVIVPVAALLLALGAPFLNVKLGTPWASVLPSDARSRLGWELAVQRFGPGALTPMIVVSTSLQGVLAPENVEAAYDFAAWVSEAPGIVRVASIVTIDTELTRDGYRQLYSSPSPATPQSVRMAVEEFTSESGDASLMSIFTAYPPTSDEAKSLVREIRAKLPGGDLRTYVTGATADLMDTTDRMYSDFPKVVAYVVVATYLALLLLFRSVVLPLKAVILNFMSILASFGALVFVFQQGHFQAFLGFKSEGFTEATVPIILFCVVFGLSMDYEVFLLSRIKEEYDATGDNVASVARGMERSGRIITSAALVMVLVAAGFATGDILIVKALGFGTALAIFIDSTVVRALLVPALMRVLSGANWWAPRFLSQAHEAGRNRTP